MILEVKSSQELTLMMQWKSALCWLTPNNTRCSLWARMVCVYLELILKTNTISMVRRIRWTVKTVSAREIVCSFIPQVSVGYYLFSFKNQKIQTWTIDCAAATREAHAFNTIIQNSMSCKVSDQCNLYSSYRNRNDLLTCYAFSGGQYAKLSMSKLQGHVDA